MEIGERSAIDPVCGKAVDPLRARAIGIFGGVTYYFCSAACKAGFADPRRSERAEPLAAAPSRAVAKAAIDAPTPIVAATPDAIAAAPAPRRRGWILVAGVIVVAAGVALRFGFAGDAPTASPPPPSPSPSPPPSPSPSPSPSPPPSPSPSPPPSPPPSPSPSPSSATALTPPLRLGLRWFVLNREGGAELVERLLVLDAAEHATIYEVARIDLRGNVASRDGSAPLTPKEAFASSTAEPGVVYEDAFVAGEVHLDVRVERRADAVVAESRTHATGAWKTTLTLPLAADVRVRGAPFAKKRYDEVAAEGAAPKP